MSQARRRRVALVVLYSLLVLFSCHGRVSGAAQEKESIRGQAVLELLIEDSQTLTPAQVVAECTALLNERGKQDATLAVSALERRGEAYSRLGNLPSAREDYVRLLAIAPDDVRARWNYANVLAASGLKDDARKEVERVLKLDPSFADAYVTLAGILFEKGDISASIENCTKAIALDKRCCLAYYNRALVYYTQGKATACLQDLDRLLEMQPLLPLYSARPEEIYDLKGRALLALNRPKDALTNFLVARKLSPSSASAIWGLWQSYTILRKHRAACVLAEELVRLAPGHAQSQIALSRSCASVGKEEEAVKACEKALEIDSRNPEVLIESGVVFATIGRYEMALTQLGKVTKNYPSNVRAVITTASLFASCPDGKFRDGLAARDLILGIMRLDPGLWKNPECLITLAMAQAECGEFKKAVELAQRALAEAAPDHFARFEYEEKLKCFQAGRAFHFDVREKR